MLIRNYGLFWKRENVHWGYGGHLQGVTARGSSNNLVDFREQQGVYILYDNSFRLVYVGQAGGGESQRLFVRLKQHRNDHLADRWQLFSWYGINTVNLNGTLRVEKMAAHVDIGTVLNHIEAILIYAAEPPHNRQGGRFGEEVQQYFQHRDEASLGPSENEMVKRLYAKMMRDE